MSKMPNSVKVKDENGVIVYERYDMRVEVEKRYKHRYITRVFEKGNLIDESVNWSMTASADIIKTSKKNPDYEKKMPIEILNKFDNSKNFLGANGSSFYRSYFYQHCVLGAYISALGVIIIYETARKGIKAFAYFGALYWYNAKFVEINLETTLKLFKRFPQGVVVEPTEDEIMANIISRKV